MRSRRSKTLRGAAWLLLGTIGAMVVAPEAAEADGGVPPYLAAASADAIRLSVVSRGAPLSDNVVDGGGPTARAAITSSGTRRGFAALPDPGGGFVPLLSTGAGLAALYGLKLPFDAPKYPLAAVTEYPASREQVVGGGPYYLKATSSDQSAAAEAQSGFVQGDSTIAAAASHATAQESGEGVVASSSALLEGLKVASLVLGSVKSSAQVDLRSDGTLSRRSSLGITGGRAGDKAFTVTDKGFVFADQGVSVPFGEGLISLNKELAPSKTRIAFVPEHQTGNGVVAPILEVRSLVPSPLGAMGDGSVVLRIGGAAASIDTETTESAAATQSSASGGDTSAEAVAPSLGPADGSVPGLPSLNRQVKVGGPSDFLKGQRFLPGSQRLSAEVPSSLGVPRAEFDVSSGSVDGEEPVPTAVEASGFAPQPRLQARPVSRVVEEASFSVSGVYLVIVALAIVGLITGSLLQKGGRWNS